MTNTNGPMGGAPAPLVTELDWLAVVDGLAWARDRILAGHPVFDAGYLETPSRLVVVYFGPGSRSVEGEYDELIRLAAELGPDRVCWAREVRASDLGRAMIAVAEGDGRVVAWSMPFRISDEGRSVEVSRRIEVGRWWMPVLGVGVGPSGGNAS